MYHKKIPYITQFPLCCCSWVCLQTMEEEGRKGIFWQGEEVELMLATLLDLCAGRRVMRSTHLPTILLFRRVACTLGTAGYPLNFKVIKAAFFKAMEDWQGIPRFSARPPHFQVLHQLWEQGGRPPWREQRHKCEYSPPQKKLFTLLFSTPATHVICFKFKWSKLWLQ